MTDIAKTLFETGVDFLASKDVKRPRPVLGNWRKKHGDAEILRALQVAMREDVSEPVAYITRILNGAQNSDLMQSTIDEIHAAEVGR